jgi:hypothetical protein
MTAPNNDGSKRSKFLGIAQRVCAKANIGFTSDQSRGMFPARSAIIASPRVTKE